MTNSLFFATNLILLAISWSQREGALLFFYLSIEERSFVAACRIKK